MSMGNASKRIAAGAMAFDGSRALAFHKCFSAFRLRSRSILAWTYPIGVSVILTAVLLVSPRAEASCTCGGEELEMVFMLDCSGSMNHMLNTLQQQVRHLLDALEGQVRHKRAAVIVYRTREYAGRQRKLHIFPFTSDTEKLTAFMRGQTAEGGGHEMVEEALDAALNRLDWSKGARKVAVLLGDEQPKEKEQKVCLKLARKMKERGIILNAVTASQTAWIYWAPLNETNWKEQVRDMGKDAKRVFRLPFYSELAEAGGGISVSSWNSRELVLWLLGFGLGLKEKEVQKRVDVGKFLEWSKQREMASAEGAPGASAAEDKAKAEAGDGIPLIAWLKHGGDWEVPHRFGRVFEHLSVKLALSGPPRVKVLSLLNPDLPRYPIMYVTGHGPVKWSGAERRILKKQLKAGGFLFADACCGDPEFTKSIQEVLGALFPDSAFRPLKPEHEIFSCGYRVSTVRRSAQSRRGPLREETPELKGFFVPQPGDGKPRLAVVLSPFDLGCAWQSQLLGVPCMHSDKDGMALSANVFVWALTR